MSLTLAFSPLGTLGSRLLLREQVSREKIFEALELLLGKRVIGARRVIVRLDANPPVAIVVEKDGQARYLRGRPLPGEDEFFHPDPSCGADVTTHGRYLDGGEQVHAPRDPAGPLVDDDLLADVKRLDQPDVHDGDDDDQDAVHHHDDELVGIPGFRITNRRGGEHEDARIHCHGEETREQRENGDALPRWPRDPQARHPRDGVVGIALVQFEFSFHDSPPCLVFSRAATARSRQGSARDHLSARLSCPRIRDAIRQAREQGGIMFRFLADEIALVRKDKPLR